MGLWNKCQDCGKFIGYDDLADGRARHVMLEPSSLLGVECWETLCSEHTPPHTGNED